MTSNVVDPKQLQIWYDRLTHRLAALDKDISRALSEYERANHRERWQEVAADRELLVRYQEALEADQSMPGPWPPRFSSILTNLPYYEELIGSAVYDWHKPVTAGTLIDACNQQVSRVLEDLSQKYDPDLYVQRAIETELASFINSFSSNVSRNCYLIVAPAGSGKTNLLAHLASCYVERQPVLLILGGNAYLSPADGLVGAIQSELELALPEIRFHSAADALHTLERLSHETGRNALVLVDAINEHDQPGQMRKAVEDLLSGTRGRPIKLIITCRDYYWGLFEGRFWASAVVNELPRDHSEETEFSRFAEDEHKQALDLYLQHYKITGRPTGRAADQCRHPLLLRFFCEAYRGQEIGPIEDIRLKELFDQYWENKVASIAERMLSQGSDRRFDRLTEDASSYLLALASYMLHHNVRSVPRSSLALVTGHQEDPGDRRSTYFRIRDEYIILEERERGSGNHIPKQVAFVYEEFMEYVMARALMHEWLAQDVKEVEILKQVEDLTSKYGDFVQILGVVVYLAVMLKEETGIALWPLLIARGKVWQGVVFEAIRKLPESEIDSSIYSFFLELLAGEDSGIKKSALATLKLKRLVQNAPGWLVEELARLAVDRRGSIRRQALLALVNAPVQPAGPVLVAYLGYPDKYTAKSAHKALVRLGDPVVDSLMAALSVESRDARIGAVKTLRVLKTERSVGALVPILQDPDEELRREATKALGNIWGLFELTGLGSRQAKTRIRAAKALANKCDSRVVFPLIARLKDEEASVREEAVRTLGKCRYPEAIQALTDALFDPDIKVSRQAVDALEKIGDPTSIEPLKQLVGAEDPVTRLMVIGSLLNLGDESCMGILENLLQSVAQDDRVDIMKKLDDLYGLKGLLAMPSANPDPAADIESTRPSLAPIIAQHAGPHAKSGFVSLLDFGRAVTLWIDDKDHTKEAGYSDETWRNASYPRDARFFMFIAMKMCWDTTDQRLQAFDLMTNVFDELPNEGARRLMRFVSEISARHEDERIRAAAVELLGILGGDEAIACLKPSLGDASDKVREKTLDALAILRAPEKVELLINALNDSNPEIQSAALEVLGAVGDIGAEPAILNAWHSPDSNVRRSAIRALGLIWRIGKLVAVASAIPQVSELAMAKLESRAASLVTQVLRPDWDWSDTKPLQDEIVTLAIMGQPSIAMLVAALSDKDATVRALAAEKLGSRGDDRTIQPLVYLLDDEDAAARLAAIRALGQFDPHGIDPLIAALKHRDKATRVAAIEELMVKDDERVIEPLIDLLEVQDSAMSLAAIRMLGWFGTMAIDPLIAASRHRDADIRSAAIEELMASRDERAIPLIVNLLEDEASSTRLAAVRALGEFGSKGVDPLIAASNHKDTAVRIAAIEMLSASQYERAIQPLCDLLEHEDSATQLAAVEALAQFGPRGIDPLIIASQHRDAAVRMAAIAGLGISGEEKALQALVRLQEDESHWVRSSEDTAKAGSRNIKQEQLVKSRHPLGRSGQLVIGVGGTGASALRKFSMRLGEMGLGESSRYTLHLVRIEESDISAPEEYMLKNQNDFDSQSDPNWRRRRALIEELMSSDPVGSVPRIRSLLLDPHPYVVWSAARALHRIASADSLASLGLTSAIEDN